MRSLVTEIHGKALNGEAPIYRKNSWYWPILTNKKHNWNRNTILFFTDDWLLCSSLCLFIVDYFYLKLLTLRLLIWTLLISPSLPPFGPTVELAFCDLLFKQQTI